MRILSISVRNYRLHGNVTVELDPSRTVIAGPNETGKSTLMEAAHRALFLKARVTGGAQKAMASHCHAGQPEVEVVFDAQGKRYRIAKRFSGATGSAILSEEGGATWRDAEAEERLAQLLRVPRQSGGRTVIERINNCWAHLWVTQERAGEDPLIQATAQKDALLARLQTEGGAGAMQSQLDTAVSGHFKGLQSEIYGKRGNVRKDSELSRAVAELEAAETKREQAGQMVDDLSVAADSLLRAQCAIRDTGASLGGPGGLEAQELVVERKLGEAGELQLKKESQTTVVNQIAGALQILAAGDIEIKRLEAEISSMDTFLEAAVTEEEALVKGEASLRAELEEAQKAEEKSRVGLRCGRKYTDLATAYIDMFEATAQSKQLQSRSDELRELEKNIEHLDAELAKLPGILAEDLEDLRELNRAYSEAEVALDAMAASIEVLSTSLEIRVGGGVLLAGQKRVIGEGTEIEIGETVKLKVSPGGGLSLAQARDNLRISRENFADGLEKLGVQSVGEAIEVFKRQQSLQLLISMSREKIGKDEVAKTKEKHAVVKKALEKSRAVIARAGAIDGFSVPADLREAKTRLEWVRKESDRLDLQETGVATHREALSTKWSDALTKLINHRAKMAESRMELSDLKGEVRGMVKIHGKEEARRMKLEELRVEQAKAKEDLALVSARLEGLQPEQLERDRDRIARAIGRARGVISEAKMAAAVAQARLKSDGTSDPASELLLAEARVRSAEEHLLRVGRRAEAISLLGELFAKEKHALADEFTRPLAEKVTSYLRCVFGPDAGVRVTLTDDRFEGLHLARKRGTFEFLKLSGGTREQVAAAFHLATAEILAAEHDGCLPVVFDDSFANSDPERIQTLQRMLDLAAQRDLQVVILTCTPADYVALGAKAVELCIPGRLVA